MPVYNAEKTLKKAMKSVLSQTFKNIHLVVIDDNSTDKSLAIAKQFLSDSRVSVYKNKQNMGAYYSRNIGLYLSKDLDWTHFTTHDADDISFKNRYKDILKMMNANEKIVAAEDTFDRISLDTGKVISSSVTFAHAIFVREVFGIMGYFDSVRFGGDWEYWTRLKRIIHDLDQKQKVIRVRTVMGESYIHDSNLTVLIPEGSKQRNAYVYRANRKIDKIIKLKTYYYDFVPEPKMTKRETL